MEKLIAQVVVLVSGYHAGFFTIYETKDGKFRAVPENKWETQHTQAEYEEFIFWKEGKKWLTDRFIFEPILEQIIDASKLQN